MDISSLRTASSAFGPNDLLRSRAEQSIGKLDTPVEFQTTLLGKPLLGKSNERESIARESIGRESIGRESIGRESIAAESIGAEKVPAVASDGEEMRKAFQDFVGQTLFGQMISSMRSTQEDAAYFNGGRAEKIFQGQLDQILSEELSEAGAARISDPMYKLFQLRRQ